MPRRNGLLEKFISDCQGEAYRFAYGLSGNDDEARDLIQEALCRTITAWGRYDESRPFNAWFFTIMRNAFTDDRRRWQLNHQISLDESLDGQQEETLGNIVSDGDGDPLIRLEREEVAKSVRYALAHLSAEHQEVLMLCDVDERRYDDVARGLGVPLGTVRSRLARARQSLRSLVEKGEGLNG